MMSAAITVQESLDEATKKQALRECCALGNSRSGLQLLDVEPILIGIALDDEGNTCLHLAAWGGHLVFVQQLLDRKADANLKDKRLRSPLHIAAIEQHADVALELLLRKAEPNMTDNVQQTPLHKAVLGEGIEVLKVLVEYGGCDITLGDEVQCSPLLLAAEYGKVEAASFLLDKDPSLVFARNQCDWTALHLAANGLEERRAPKKPVKYQTVLSLLIAAKAPINATDEDNKTPLHRAAAVGNGLTVATLLTADADVSAEDHCRWMPLHYAVQNGHVDIATALLHAKALVQRENPTCVTPLAVATMEGQAKTAELLMKHKADPNLNGKGLASAIMIARQDKDRFGQLLSLFELGFISHAD